MGTVCVKEMPKEEFSFKNMMYVSCFPILFFLIF